MPCDRRLKRNQTLSQRKEEIKKGIASLQTALAQGKVKLKVNKQNGGIVYEGLTEAARDGMSDGCIYRALMATGSSLVKQLLAKAEAAAGRGVDAKALALGLHSHNGVWHEHK